MFLEQNWSSVNYFKIVLKDSITVAILLPTLRKFHASALLSLLQEPAPGLTGVCNPPCHTQATPWPRCRQCWDLQFCTPIITAHQWPHQGVQGSAMRMRTPLPRTLAFSAFHAAQRLPGRQLCSFFFSQAKRLRSNERSPRREGDLPILRVPHFLWTKL